MTRKLTPMMYDGFDRGLVSIARATAIAAALCFAVAAPLRAADQPSTNTPAMTPAPATAPTKDNATATPAAGRPCRSHLWRYRAHQELHRGGRQRRGEEGDRRAHQGRRLRVPRSEAQRRSPSRLRRDQDRARHGRLWLVPERQLSRQGRAKEEIRHRFLVQA